MKLTGKLALVTGSTTGIGACIAQSLAKAGCNVIVTGLGEKGVIDDIVHNLKTQYNVHAEYIGANLKKTDEIKMMVSKIQEHHPEGVDILINNAAVDLPGYIDKLPDDDWDTMMAVNLSASFHLIKAFLPGMKTKGWGRIVNVASIHSHVCLPRRAAYCATKHGLIGLTKGVALELAQSGVTCNAVSPGMTDTKFTQGPLEEATAATKLTPQQVQGIITKNVPTGKMIRPEQVAELVLFLVESEASAQITGASYIIDGGFTAS